MIALYDDEQSMTRKFTSLVIYCGYAPTTTDNIMVLTGCTLSLKILLRVNSLDEVDLVQASFVGRLGNIKCLPNFHCLPTPF